MPSETFENISLVLKHINTEDEARSTNNNIYIYKPCTQTMLTLHQHGKHIQVEQYVKENCTNKLKILNTKTFYRIKKPIIIVFNHFREKCAYHTKWLDRMYKMALTYGERIEFIAADMFDLDIIYTGRNPINFFCSLVRSEDATPIIFAIDEKKRIHKHMDAYNADETLMELCKNLLNGNLFPSMPIPKTVGTTTSLVKVCVHDNYEDLILKSQTNIFLIINVENYHFHQYEPNYRNVAKALKDYNIDIVYMEAEKNYIPFEYHVTCYPTILYIPYRDKKNFIYYNEAREEETIIKFLKRILEKPTFLEIQQKQLKLKISRKNIQVPEDFQIEFQDLSEILENNFGKNFKILDRQLLEKAKDTVIIVFMDFQGKCLENHIKWLNKIYQVAEFASTFLFFIADFKDIDVINTKWNVNNLIRSSQGKPKIFALDYLKHKYEMEDFNSISLLFYFVEDIHNGYYYYSQLSLSNEMSRGD